MSLEIKQIKNIVEGALLVADRTLSIDHFLALFDLDQLPERDEIKQVLKELEEDFQGRSAELVKVSSGYRLQVRQDYSPWISRLWEEKAPRYSRALLETLSLIAYKQPITRGEIESIRGVAVSSHIIKTLIERDWAKVVGHKDTPGRPAMYATSKEFLDYFGLKSLENLPTLAEVRDLDKINQELPLEVIQELDQVLNASSNSSSNETEMEPEVGEISEELGEELNEELNEEAGENVGGETATENIAGEADEVIGIENSNVVNISIAMDTENQNDSENKAEENVTEEF